MTGLGLRELFSRLDVPHYLNFAAIGPLSDPVVEAMRETIEEQAVRGIGGIGAMLEARDRAKAAIAALVGTSADDVALTGSTSAGVTSIALCFPWRPGDAVLVFDGEFPANVTPWQRAAELFGLSVRHMPASAFQADEAAALGEVARHVAAGVRLVAVSAVQFSTGLRMPVRDIAQVAHAGGAQLFVDGIQAVGVTPIDLRRDGIDYLAAGGHKWLGGPFGTGFVAVAPHRWSDLRPHMASWLSHDEPMSFLSEGPGHLKTNRPLVAGPSMFEGGAFNAVGAAGLAVAAEILVGLGVEAIAAHVAPIADAFEERLLGLGLTSLRSPAPHQRAGIVAMVPPDGVTAEFLSAELGRRGISTTTPDGNLRISVHRCTSTNQVAPVCDAVAEILATRG